MGTVVKENASRGSEAKAHVATELAACFRRIVREALLGPAYWMHKRLIRVSRGWDAEQQRRYQERKVRRVFARHDRSRIRSKDEYRNWQERFNRLCVPGLVKVMRTGGTSGTPLIFYMDRFARRQKERAYLFDIWGAVGYRPFDLRVVYRGNVGKKLISYQWEENCYVISPSLLTRDNGSEVQTFLATLPPFFLHVYPSSLFTLIDLLGEGAFAHLPVRGVLAGSEVFPASQREAFERKFGIPVAHWYGHSEYATLARHCRVCGGFHFFPTYGYTEFIPSEDGRHKIVATSFNAIGTQFVRYDTGDRAIMGVGVCPAPYVTRVNTIEGREQESFLDNQGVRRAFGPYLFGIHDEFWDRVSAVQFVQRIPGKLDVNLVVRSATHRHWLEAYLRSRFQVCQLEFSYVTQIPRTTGGKHRYYISALEQSRR